MYEEIASNDDGKPSDYIIRGEGEKTFGDMLDAIEAAGHHDLRYIVQASTVGIASSPALAQKMASAGFRIVFLGIKCVSEGNLRLMKKGNIIKNTPIISAPRLPLLKITLLPIITDSISGDHF